MIICWNLTTLIILLNASTSLQKKSLISIVQLKEIIVLALNVKN